MSNDDKEQCEICEKWYKSLGQHKRSAHQLNEDGPNVPITDLGRLSEMAQRTPILAKRKRDLYLKSGYVTTVDDQGVETVTKATPKQKALRNGSVTVYLWPNGKFAWAEPTEVDE